MKCKCGFEIEKIIAIKHGCLMCGDKSFINLEEQNRLAQIRKQKGRTKRGKEYYYEGEYKTLRDWSKIVGITYMTLYNRIKTGLTLEQAIRK